MKIRNTLSLVLIIFSTIMVFDGCNKKEDTIVKVYVRDADMVLVPDATVRIYGTSTTQQPSAFADTSISNSSGEAVFNLNDVYQLGQAGVAVLDIEVTKGSQFGQGIIKVVEETTSEETVYIQ